MSTATFEAPPNVDYWEDDETAASPSGTGEELLDRVAGPVEKSRSDDRVMFDLLADELEHVMLVAGSTRRLAKQPAYAEILTMGERAIPLLLERANRPGIRPIWLRILGTLTSYQPGAGQRSVPEAAAEWIRWGKLRGYTP